MFNKKFSLLLITLVFMLSISCVAAIDTATPDDIEASEADEEPPSGSTFIDPDLKSASQDDFCLETKDLSMFYRNGSKYEVTLTQANQPVENATVVINICGVNYTKVTNNEGKVFLGIKLNPGNYSISTSYKSICLESDVFVLPTLFGDDVVKTYKNGTQYYASFLDNNGNPLANSDVNFNINGVFYTRKTNDDGIAKLNINLNSGKYVITAIHENGLMCSNLITVLPSVYGADLTKYYLNKSQYVAGFYNSAGKVLKKTNVTFNINGVFYTRQTDNNGIARLNIKLFPGSYVITSINPVTGEMASNKVNVLSTLISSNVISDTHDAAFAAVLMNNDGTVAKNKNVSFNVDGVSYTATTNKQGMALVELNLSSGVHEVVSTDLFTGLKVYNYINVTAQDEVINEILYYSQYGVSPDNKTLMAIGRPSAPGELSEYGYKFYMTTFERICPYCGSSELYWGIFWTDDELTNYGVFPATGNKEGGSAEGHIFCANCDADWSIFGNEHTYSGNSLKIISESVLSSKAAAYMLKNGEMIYS